MTFFNKYFTNIKTSMAKITVSDAVRIIPRESDFLNRKSGLRGEIFYDQTANTLRIYNGSTVGGLNLARGDLVNVTNSDFRSKSVASKLSTVTYQVTITGPQGADTGNKYNLNGSLILIYQYVYMSICVYMCLYMCIYTNIVQVVR